MRFTETGLVIGVVAAWLGGGSAVAEEVLPKPPTGFKGVVDASRDRSTPDWPQAVKAAAGGA